MAVECEHEWRHWGGVRVHVTPYALRTEQQRCRLCGVRQIVVTATADEFKVEVEVEYLENPCTL